MALLALSFASGEDTLSVRHFAVHEALSALFQADVVALSPHEDIDLDSIVGQRCSLRIDGGAHGVRVWDGLCSRFEQVQAEDRGLSAYAVRIVPQLWLATQRSNSRIFQHVTIPEIVTAILADWKIEPVWSVDRSRHPKQEYRVQYAESDFVFVSRLLEEAGISYAFAHDSEKGSVPVFTDRPQAGEPRAGGPIPFVDKPNPEAGLAFLTDVRVAREIRPGAFTVRDFDFRRKTDHALFGSATPARGVEGKLEQYHYRPGAFVTEGAPGGEHAAASDDREGAALAARSLEAERSSSQVVSFRTNLLDLAPGAVFSMSRHARSGISAPKTLLSVSFDLEGTPGGEWTLRGRAVPTREPHRPARVTPRPSIHGVQSAVVVGPAGEEIHTDEFGRVRVQFHWDREGDFDEHSSCWIRVSQGWAGAGYGMMAVPRVGQEVTVGFFEGDPDQPIVIGRVHNVVNRVPYPLPEHRTRSTWKSRSTPDGDGYNEIMLEDKAGAELISIHAERDLEKLVKQSEVERTGVDRTLSVGRNRTITVGSVDATTVGQRHLAAVVPPGGGSRTSFEMTDRHIVCTTGEATVTFAGPDITLEAKGNITIVSREGDVVIRGGPNVKINSD